MPSSVYVNNNKTLLNNLSWFGRKHDIEFVNFQPKKGWLLMNSRSRMRSSSLYNSCREKIIELRDKGEKIICVAFYPYSGNGAKDRWVILTDKGYATRLIPRECINKLAEYKRNGHKLLWVAFPPKGGNSWSIITDRGFTNKNIPNECHQKMLEYHNTNNKALCVAFNSRGGNSWTIIRKRGFFNRNSPPNCHNTMLRMHEMGYHIDKIAFGSRLDQWAIVSNGHPSRENFKPSIHGFQFNNTQMPVNLIDAIREDLPVQGIVIESILNTLSNVASHIPFIGNQISDAISPSNLTAGMTFCGGMSQAAKDHYLMGLNISDITSAPTSPDDPMTKYLYDRQLDTLGRIPNMKWAQEFYLRTKLDLNEQYKMSLEEWYDLKRKLDRPGGRLVVLGILYSHAEKLWDNHQVLAYGYEIESQRAKIHIYDPNRRNDDDSIIDMWIPYRGRGTIVQRGTRRSLNIKGFFIMEPNKRNPTNPPRIPSRFPDEGIPLPA